MAIQGQAKEQKDFSKEVGIFEGKVVAINPNKEQLEKLLDTTIDKEPVYASEDEMGVKKATLVFWLEDQKSKKLKSLRFFLKDVEKTNKDKTKKQYITDLGDTSWTDDVNNLPEWFKARSHRVAKEGEDALYKFAKDWLGKLNKKVEGAELSFDWKKLMSGDARELVKEINGSFDTTVVVLNTVRVVESNGDVKEYEQVYNQEFLPNYAMPYVRAAKIDETFIEIAKKQDRKNRSRLQSFVLAVTDPQYGVKDHYILGELSPYVPGKNIAASDKVISEDDTSY